MTLPSQRKLSIPILPLTVATLLTIAGCETISRDIGGKEFPVMVNSQPPGATLYFIPTEIWTQHGEKLLTDPDLKETLDYGRVTSNTWPAKVFLQAKPYTAIAVRNGKHTTQAVTPKTPDESITILAPQ